MRQAATDTQNLIIQRDTACGPDDTKRTHDISTDTSSLISLQDRTSGLDIPRELLSRHVSTDTRTLILTRDNFSTPMPIAQKIQFNVHTQSIPIEQHDASSNTVPQAEQRDKSIQVGY